MTVIKNFKENRRIAQRISEIRPSGLRKLFDLEYKIAKSSSQKILSFGLGNLNIPTHSEIINKLKEKIDDPISHRYSSTAGLLELRESLVSKYKRLYNLDYTPDQVVITSGCLEVLFDTFLAITNPSKTCIFSPPLFVFSGKLTCTRITSPGRTSGASFFIWVLLNVSNLVVINSLILHLIPLVILIRIL